MKLSKAIKKLRTWLHIEVSCPDKDLETAVQLGIQALYLVLKERRDKISYAGELLPGETEEDQNDTPKSY